MPCDLVPHFQVLHSPVLHFQRTLVQHSIQRSASSGRNFLKVHPSDRLPFALEFRNHNAVLENHSGRAASARKKSDDIFSRLDIIPACDISSHPAIFRQQGPRSALYASRSNKSTRRSQTSAAHNNIIVLLLLLLLLLVTALFNRLFSEDHYRLGMAPPKEESFDLLVRDFIQAGCPSCRPTNSVKAPTPSVAIISPSNQPIVCAQKSFKCLTSDCMQNATVDVSIIIIIGIFNVT